jgi:ribosome biogenesis protein Tsr3
MDDGCFENFGLMECQNGTNSAQATATITVIIVVMEAGQDVALHFSWGATFLLKFAGM